VHSPGRILNEERMAKFGMNYVNIWVFRTEDVLRYRILRFVERHDARHPGNQCGRKLRVWLHHLAKIPRYAGDRRCIVSSELHV